MMTLTARRHVESALRSRLRINAANARDILERFENRWTVNISAPDMRGCVAVVCDNGFDVNVYSVSDGILAFQMVLVCRDEDLVRWRRLSLEEAYCLPHGLRFPEPVAIEREETLPIVEDYPFEEDCAPYGWENGVVLSQEIVDGHVRAVVEIQTAGGPDQRTMAKVPLFGTVENLALYVQEQIGTPARLCIGEATGRHIRIGIPSDMPILEMIVPESAIPSLARSVRMAA